MTQNKREGKTKFQKSVSRGGKKKGKKITEEGKRLKCLAFSFASVFSEMPDGIKSYQT